tara:strand:+ start:5105 stop:5728 length:624 start_codon:yes stop_codon:yes gene_type:complete
MNEFLDLEKIFKLAEPLKYVAIKIDAPGFTKNFPKNYPIGRDVDVVCHEEDFHKFIKICDDNITYPQDHTKHIIKDSATQTRFRVHAPSYFLRPNPRPTDKMIQGKPWTQLHFQIDITTTSNGDYLELNKDFIDALYDKIEYLNCVKVLPTEKETIFRMLVVEKTRQLSHHSDYLKSHGSLTMLKNFKKENFKNSCKDILDGLEIKR